jgi:hypothetical protein
MFKKLRDPEAGSPNDLMTGVCQRCGKTMICKRQDCRRSGEWESQWLACCPHCPGGISVYVGKMAAVIDGSPMKGCFG